MKYFSKPLSFRFRIVIAVAAVLAVLQLVVYAGQMTGAIFTTTFDGGAVDANIYDTQFDVYISGGPNNNKNAGLPANEVFYFEVTDPSGNTLLSTDLAACREVQTDGNGRIFAAVFDSPCSGPHLTGTIDAANGALPVRLFPFAQTPNNGGEYKVTLVRKDAPGVSVLPDGLTLDYPKSASKSDNYKIRNYRQGD